MQRTARRILLVSVIVVTAASGWALSAALKPRLDAVNPVRQDLTETLLVNGRTAWPRRVELGAMVQGTVADVLVEEGAVVAEDALLVRLDDQEPAARVSEAAAAVAEARAGL